MTRYTVVWKEEALEELADLWMNSPDRDAATAASAQIDVELAEDPDQKGWPVSGAMRELAVSPLAVLYKVREPDRIAEVASASLMSDRVSGNGAPLS